MLAYVLMKVLHKPNFQFCVKKNQIKKSKTLKYEYVSSSKGGVKDQNLLILNSNKHNLS